MRIDIRSDYARYSAEERDLERSGVLADIPAIRPQASTTSAHRSAHDTRRERATGIEPA
jgi:hypothetical protein